jgi:hypothetical protein
MAVNVNTHSAVEATTPETVAETTRLTVTPLLPAETVLSSPDWTGTTTELMTSTMVTSELGMLLLTVGTV